jgi:acyl carrier protein
MAGHLDPLAYVVMGSGALLMLIGVVFFAKRGAEGTNTVKMLGAEFQVAGSSLVIFAVGAIFFIIPIVYQDRLRIDSSLDDHIETSTTPEGYPATDTQTTLTNTQTAANASTNPPGFGVRRQTVQPSLEGEIRRLVANRLGVSPKAIDPTVPLKQQPIRFDDLDAVEVLMELEDRYKVEIKDNEIDPERVTIDQLANLVRTHQR